MVSGPFMIGAWQRGQRVTLVRNPHFQPQPYLDQIVFRIIPEPDDPAGGAADRQPWTGDRRHLRPDPRASGAGARTSASSARRSASTTTSATTRAASRRSRDPRSAARSGSRSTCTAIIRALADGRVRRARRRAVRSDLPRPLRPAGLRRRSPYEPDAGAADPRGQGLARHRRRRHPATATAGPSASPS